jgi:hypothetical protein
MMIAIVFPSKEMASAAGELAGSNASTIKAAKPKAAP